MPTADIDGGMPSIVASFYGCSGQRCLAGSILAPVGDKADEIVEKFIFAARQIKVGPGLDQSSVMGPVGSATQKEKVLTYIEKGIEEGATLILDGRGIEVEGCPGGYYIGPTIFDNVTPDMTIAKEEIFGPVVCITRCDTLEDVIQLVNTRDYANATSIYTGSGADARKFKYEVTPSMVGVNIGIAAPMSFFPFGGAGNSMFGDIKGHGQEIFQFFTDTKVVIERWF